MSGGVDSSVAAAVCARQGYDVVGVTLQLYTSDNVSRKKGSCCAGQDIYDAKKVAEKGYKGINVGDETVVFEPENIRKTLLDNKNA